MITKIKILFCALSVSLVSCTNGFEELNTNPLSINEVSPDLILPNMQYGGMMLEYGKYQVSSLLYSSLYCQYYANTASHFSSDNYVINNKWTENGYWNSYYVFFLKNLRETEASLKKNPQYDDMFQIMRILAAMGTIRTTDVFGDIPYFSAGTGDTRTPYDSQDKIYYDVFEELTEAVNLLEQKRNGQLLYSAGKDLMFRGDVEKWIKLANSLRLRAAIRLSFKDPDKAKIEGELALKESLISSNNDNAAVATTSTSGHPVIGSCYYNEFRASETMMGMLQGLSGVADPRLSLMFAKTQAYVKGTSDIPYKGLPNGVAKADLIEEKYSNDYNSNVWGYMWGYTWNDASKGSNIPAPSKGVVLPLVLMNYSEICFLKAEAAIRGWSGAGKAQDNYENGIRASFEEMRTNAPKDSYTSADDEKYITTGKVAWNEAEDFESKLEKIITQKWLGIYPNSNEAWAEFRRTGYPRLNPVIDSMESTINSENGEFIKRLLYVDNEKANNADNALNPNLNGGKGDGLNVRVWWDTARYK